MTDPQPRKRRRVPILLALLLGLFGLGVAVVVVTPSPTRPADRTHRNTGADSGAPEAAGALSPSRQLQQLSAIPKRRKLDESTVADFYLDAYLMANEAMGRVEAGDAETALAELSDAQRIFERIQTELPEWRSEVVGYRSRRIAETIERLAEPQSTAEEPFGTNGVSVAEAMADIYLRGYLLADEASKLEDDGQHHAALTRYEDAIVIFDQIQRTSPGWRPEVVGYRTKKVSESIARLARR